MLETLKRIEEAWEVNLCTCKPSPIILPAYGRNDLAALFHTLGFQTGAEIGVERGHFSKTLCKANPGVRLTCVDAWTAYEGYREHVPQSRVDGFLQETRERLKRFNVDIRKGFSVDVAQTIPDQSFDFIYLDANHTFEDVLLDIQTWEPKLRSNGILAGHDYVDRPSLNYGVKQAVKQFTHTHHVQSWCILAADNSPSWFWVKK